jgi:hypothetical protein
MTNMDRILQWLVEHFYTVSLPALSVGLLVVAVESHYDDWRNKRGQWLPVVRWALVLGLMAFMWIRIWDGAVPRPKHFVPRPHYVYTLEVRP